MKYETPISLSCISKYNLCGEYERNKIEKIVTITYTVRKFRTHSHYDRQHRLTKKMCYIHSHKHYVAPKL
jgi:hypothetical protein